MISNENSVVFNNNDSKDLNLDNKLNTDVPCNIDCEVDMKPNMRQTDNLFDGNSEEKSEQDEEFEEESEEEEEEEEDGYENIKEENKSLFAVDNIVTLRLRSENKNRVQIPFDNSFYEFKERVKNIYNSNIIYLSYLVDSKTNKIITLADENNKLSNSVYECDIVDQSTYDIIRLCSKYQSFINPFIIVTLGSYILCKSEKVTIKDKYKLEDEPPAAKDSISSTGSSLSLNTVSSIRNEYEVPGSEGKEANKPTKKKRKRVNYVIQYVNSSTDKTDTPVISAKIIKAKSNNDTNLNKYPANDPSNIPNTVDKNENVIKSNDRKHVNKNKNEINDSYYPNKSIDNHKDLLRSGSKESSLSKKDDPSILEAHSELLKSGAGRDHKMISVLYRQISLQQSVQHAFNALDDNYKIKFICLRRIGEMLFGDSRYVMNPFQVLCPLCLSPIKLTTLCDKRMGNLMNKKHHMCRNHLRGEDDSPSVITAKTLLSRWEVLMKGDFTRMVTIEVLDLIKLPELPEVAKKTMLSPEIFVNRWDFVKISVEEQQRLINSNNLESSPSYKKAGSVSSTNDKDYYSPQAQHIPLYQSPSHHSISSPPSPPQHSSSTHRSPPHQHLHPAHHHGQYEYINRMPPPHMDGTSRYRGYDRHPYGYDMYNGYPRPIYNVPPQEGSSQPASTISQPSGQNQSTAPGHMNYKNARRSSPHYINDPYYSYNRPYNGMPPNPDSPERYYPQRKESNED